MSDTHNSCGGGCQPQTEILQLGRIRRPETVAAPHIKVSRKLVIQMMEANVVCGAYRYLPFSTGLLRAYAETDPIIKSNCLFSPFLYEMDTEKNVWSRLVNTPDVAAFSVSMWNEQLNLKIARGMKEIYGDKVLIVFGGCHVPHHPKEYMEQHPFIDVCVRSEGEEAFREVLLRRIDNSGYEGVLGVSWRGQDGSIVENPGNREFSKTLDNYPSPYLEGLFDYLINDQTENHKFQCIVETNRGCLAAGTIITTASGGKPIENVLPGELVLGWDEHKQTPIWNRVEKSVCTGTKEVFRVQAGEHCVEATDDHPIYTKRGWLPTSQIRSGDFLLCGVPKAQSKKVDKDLLLRMQYHVSQRMAGRTTQNHKEILQGLWQTTRATVKQLANNNIQQHLLGAVCQIPNQQLQKGRSQPNETGGGSQKGKRNKQSQGDRHWRKLRSNERIMANQAPGDVGWMAQDSPPGMQQVRKASNCIYREVQSALSVYGGLELLDWAVSVWEAEKPRLRPHNQQNKQGDFGTRSVLAQGPNRSRARSKGLCRQGLAVSNRLGRRNARRPNGRKNQVFCWVRVESITSVGSRKVYDLVNATPYPNFFANNILVHNCPFDCSFCYWAAGGLMTKYRFHAMDYVKEEVTWTGKNKIPYVFGADCLAEGTLVDTDRGPIPIESVLPEDRVRSFDTDNNKEVWSTIFASVYAGDKQVLEIECSNGYYIEASRNHRFYTKRGWIRAEYLTERDEVLSGVRQGSCREQEVLLKNMLSKSEGAGDDKKRFGKSEIGRESSLREKISKRRGSEEATCYTESKTRRKIQGGRKDGSCQENSQWNRSYSGREAKREPSQGCLPPYLRADERGQQLDEADGCFLREEKETRCQGAGDAESDGVLLDKRGQSSVEKMDGGEESRTNCELQREDENVLERSGMGRQSLSSRRAASKSIRTRTNQVVRTTEYPISVCGRSNFVDELQGEESKSRFCPYGFRSKESYLGSRALLASGRGGSNSRDRGLPTYRMAGSDCLGRRDNRRCGNREYQGFRWVKITSIRLGVVKKTYDVIHAVPAHNFFANGLLVSNSNFAMHPRDKEIAEHVVKTKRDYGFPSKFRVCFGKNTDEKIFQVATILHEADLEKGITLARQSNDETTLKNIRRDNIKLSTYKNLQVRFNDSNVPVYSELILGLPGETRESWMKGIDELLTSGLKNQLFVYLAQVLPNTELWRPDYRAKHGVKTRHVELTEIHGSKRPDDWVKEYEEIVVATASMPHREWREMCKFSWMTMLLHSMKAGFFVLGWLWDRYKIPPSELISKMVRHDLIGQTTGITWQMLKEWDALLDTVAVFGEGRGTILPEYGDIYWDVEEAALLKMSEDWASFYKDLEKFVQSILAENDIQYNQVELQEVLCYQYWRMPQFGEDGSPISTHAGFEYNTPEYFDRLFGTDPIPLVAKQQAFITKPKDWAGDKQRFARETVLWGRKSGTMLVQCEWKDAE